MACQRADLVVELCRSLHLMHSLQQSVCSIPTHCLTPHPPPIQGIANMDFVVREVRAVVNGPLAIVRFGTCGGLRDVPAGAVVLATGGAVLIRRDPDTVGEALATTPPPPPAVDSTTTLPLLPTPSRPYHISRVVKPHAGLTACYHTALEAELGDDFPVVGGVAASADSFYSSQGRVTHKFGDFNAGLLEVVEAVVPGVASLEMETFTLLDLGRSAGDPSHPIAAAGAAMVVWNRNTKESIGKEDLVEMEVRGGRACLAALVGFGLGSA